jgi:hypothetical protein
MMGERRVMQEALFYGFSLERQSPVVTCFARLTGSSTFQTFGRTSSPITARSGALRSIPS